MARSSILGSRPALGRGSAGVGDVAVATDMVALVKRLGDEADDAIEDILGSAVRRVFAGTKSGWPVRTGWSRGLLSLSDNSGQNFAGNWVLRGRAWYSKLIEQSGSNVSQRLIYIPMTREVAQAARRIAARLGGR